MRAAAFQLIATGVALGIMGGAVGIHWLHLSGAGPEGVEAGDGARDVPAEVVPAGFSAGWSGGADGDGAEAPGDGAADSEARATLAALQQIVSRLEELRDDQDHLSEQVAEANRDINVLEMRVDTHSEGFRPLPSSGFGSIRDGSITPGATIHPSPRASAVHPLLPPKER